MPSSVAVLRWDSEVCGVAKQASLERFARAKSENQRRQEEMEGLAGWLADMPCSAPSRPNLLERMRSLKEASIAYQSVGARPPSLALLLTPYRPCAFLILIPLFTCGCSFPFLCASGGGWMFTYIAAHFSASTTANSL